MQKVSILYEFKYNTLLPVVQRKLLPCHVHFAYLAQVFCKIWGKAAIIQHKVPIYQIVSILNIHAGMNDNGLCKRFLSFIFADSGKLYRMW